MTAAGDMPASDVVHVVGPVYTPGGDNEEKLRLAVTMALDSAQAPRCVVGGTAGDLGRDLWLSDGLKRPRSSPSAVAAWLVANPGVLTEVRLVAFGAGDRRRVPSCTANRVMTPFLRQETAI